MATRFLTALDYSDWHTSNVLRKHAKKRPLGELETRYQYTPPQPVLSCRTVDIDVSGTRTYRPRSTADIIAEQQKLIHSLFKSGRSVTSAPARRSPRKGLGQVNNDTEMQSRAKIHVQGRPLTSSSQASEASRQKTGAPDKRPKTTGRLKNVKPATESFMVLTVDKDMMDTRRSHTELTNQIHAHWRPDSSNLNQGHFMRGQKRPDDVPPTLDAWLTFGGAAGEESGGVVDAFANFQNAEDYYNIEGSVGSRVAKQLQKGDKIRIGINGEVLSHDLRVKKWVKGEQTPTPRSESELPVAPEDDGRTEEKGEKTPEPAKEDPPPAAEKENDLFGDVMFDSLHNIVEEQEAEAQSEKKETKVPKIPVDFPLSWEDQVSRPQVKVINARPTPRDNNRENLCETHPVLFNKMIRTAKPRPRLASSSATASYLSSSDGYRIKQRALGSTPAADNHLHRLDNHSGGKVKALTFDQHTAEDEERLKSMSVDDVVQMRLEKSDEASSAAIQGIAAAATTKHRTSSSKKQAVDKGERGPGDGEESDFSAEFHAPLDSEQNGHGRLKDQQRFQAQRSVSSLSWSSRGGGGGGGGPGQAGRPLAVPRPSSSVPMVGTRDMHLSVMSASRGPREARGGHGKGGRVSLQSPGARNTASSVYRAQHLGGGGVSSINAGPIPGDTEFIQISQPIRNPTNRPAAAAAGAGGAPGGVPYYPGMSSTGSTPLPPRSPPRSNTPENCLDNSVGSTRTATPTNSVKLNLSHGQGPEQAGLAGGSPEQQNANDSVGGENNGAASSGETPSVMSINIPTGSHQLEEDEEEELTAAQRRERSLRDKQIDQITNLLGDAILNGSKK